VFAGIVMVTLAAASWGTWSLFLRPTGLPSIITCPILFAVMGVVSLPLALRAPRVRWTRGMVALLLANTVFDALNVITFFAALAYTTVAIAVLTHYAAPILVAVFAPVVDRDLPPTRGAVPAALVALLGLVVVLEPWHAPATGAIAGGLLGLASAVCYAGNVFSVRRLAAAIGPARAMAYHSLIAALVLAPIALATAAERLGGVTAHGLALLVVGAITIGAASGIAYATGLVRIGAARAAILAYAEPLVAVAVGALVWGESLHPLAAVGGALVLGAGIHVVRGSTGTAPAG
jgi:drug/metabolite transporter (DMT)-like permease